MVDDEVVGLIDALDYEVRLDEVDEVELDVEVLVELDVLLSDAMVEMQIITERDDEVDIDKLGRFLLEVHTVDESEVTDYVPIFLEIVCGMLLVDEVDDELVEGLLLLVAEMVEGLARREHLLVVIEAEVDELDVLETIAPAGFEGMVVSEYSY